VDFHSSASPLPLLAFYGGFGVKSDKDDVIVVSLLLLAMVLFGVMVTM
jgi:hypothetical protein